MDSLVLYRKFIKVIIKGRRKSMRIHIWYDAHDIQSKIRVFR